MSSDGCVALSRGAMSLSADCDCGISWSYSLFCHKPASSYVKQSRKNWQTHSKPWTICQNDSFCKSNVWQYSIIIKKILFKTANTFQYPRLLKSPKHKNMSRLDICTLRSSNPSHWLVIQDQCRSQNAEKILTSKGTYCTKKWFSTIASFSIWELLLKGRIRSLGAVHFGMESK